MDITPLADKEKLILARYGNGGFTVRDQHYAGSILITPQGVLPWPPSSPDEITPENLQPLLACAPEIALIGMGAEFMILPPALRACFRERNIPVDAMDTGAACRTYNVLLAEDRIVAAALLAV